MRTTLSIDDALLARAKELARKEGITLGSLVDEALRDRLTASTRSRIPVQLPVFHGGGMRPGIDPTSNRSLYDALDEP